MQATEQVLEVWGDFACFTRPELKVERFSYPVITPSAARGIFDAIYCKPSKNGREAEFRWEITKIVVINPPSFIALRRNEVKEKISEGNVKKWMSGKSEVEPILADADKSITGSDQKGRTQRQTMALKNVRYRIHGRICPWPGFEDRIKGLEAQFQRRAGHGKCIYQPYFGCREFPAFFEPVAADEPLPEKAWQESINIGWMLYDVFDLSQPGTCNSKPFISLFDARVVNGVLNIPAFDSAQVLRPEQGGVKC